MEVGKVSDVAMSAEVSPSEQLAVGNGQSECLILTTARPPLPNASRRRLAVLFLMMAGNGDGRK